MCTKPCLAAFMIPSPSLLQIVHLAHQSRTLNRRHPRLGRAALASSEPQLPSFRPGQLAWLASLCVSSHLRYNLADLRMTRLVVERGLAVAQGLPTPQAATQLLSAAASVRLRAPKHQKVGTPGLAACVQLGGPERQQACMLGAAASLRQRGALCPEVTTMQCFGVCVAQHPDPRRQQMSALNPPAAVQVPGPTARWDRRVLLHVCT